ncbi:hypothetical protein E4K72_11890 [Oxalobacteraceae bacterium OM1]|nr:hypothetical protein E4K72_11890 [Oxalobacteraceae bacterium OM1]
MKRHILLCTTALLLAACASDGQHASTERDEGYVPTGSNIPRRSVDRTGAQVLNKDQLESMRNGAGYQTR